MTPEQFKQARQSLGLTGEQLGEWMGYGGGAKGSISRIEGGKVRITPRIARLMQLATLMHEIAPDALPDWPS